jgi:hypothetical protein
VHCIGNTSALRLPNVDNGCGIRLNWESDKSADSPFGQAGKKKIQKKGLPVTLCYS